MNFNFTVHPNQLSEQFRHTVTYDVFPPVTLAYIDRYTYCLNTVINSGLEFCLPKQNAYHNVHIGSFCSIGQNLTIYIGRNHDIKNISTGAVDLLARSIYPDYSKPASTFNQKSLVMIQNDVWIGDNVTIMPNVIIHNGACIAKNSHVVKDVPPYAIVGGNPAKIIGYRYSDVQIENLLKLQWWYWDIDTITKRIPFFDENPDSFYNNFRSEKYESDIENLRKLKEKDHFFAFVDYYEHYPACTRILDQFITKYSTSSSHKLTLAIQEEYLDNTTEQAEFINNFKKIINTINSLEQIYCTVELIYGTRSSLSTAFASCSDYAVSRTYDSVYFASLADTLGIRVFSGTDSIIQFIAQHNMYT